MQIKGLAARTDTHQALLEAAHEAVRLQQLSRRDRELIDEVRRAFPTMSEAEVIQQLRLWGGL